MRLKTRLFRNDLRRAVAILLAIDSGGTNKTWGSTGKPDSDVMSAIIAAGDSAGISPNRLLYGLAAWQLRYASYEQQATAGAFAALNQTADQVAQKLGLSGGRVSSERYQSAASTKSKVVGSFAVVFFGEDGVGKDDPSSLKRFVTPVAEGAPVTLSPTIIFDTPATSGTFTASNQALRLLVGETARIPLLASHPATWAIDSGAPAGFAVVAVEDAGAGIEFPPGVDYVLVGTPTTAGTASVALTATRTADSDTAAVVIDLTITNSAGTGDKTVIVSNPGWLNNGLTYDVGEQLALALISQPAPATWSATGLPPGITLDASSGLLSGAPTIEGRFIASIAATAPGKSASLPALITFTIRPGKPGTTPPAVTPQNRIPWIMARWDMIDLQVLARTRVVESTLMGTNGIRIKLGDALAFPVFFVGADNVPFDLAPTKIRFIIRPVNNADEALVFQTNAAPAVVTTEADPYYLITAATGAQQREIVEAWLDDQEKNEGLPCVGEIEWTKDSKVYSSASFPIMAELDVVRP